MMQKYTSVLFFFAVCTLLSANFPEHAEHRYRNRDLIFASVDVLIKLLEQPSLLPQSERAYIEVEETEKYVYLVFTPHRRVQDGEYPLGSYIIRRLKIDGSFSQVKILLTRNTVMRIVPHTLGIGISISGRKEHKNIHAPMRFESLLLMPFAQLRDITQYLIDWEYLLPDVQDERYHTVAHMVKELRRRLPELPDAEDGAMDEQGNLVFIESLGMQEQLPGFNCSGFAKWVVDGLYEPKYGSLLSLARLKIKHEAERGTKIGLAFDEARDPYFGLDWSRNLAAALKGTEYQSDIAVDVRSAGAAYYHEDVGYAVRDLESVLYWLAVHEPGNIYIGSVNKEFGQNPVLRQHIHVVVLFPYFDESGIFQTVVMERNLETGILSLEQRYAGDFIHLVRVEGSNEFAPPSFKLH